MEIKKLPLIEKLPHYNLWADDQIRLLMKPLSDAKFAQDLENLFVNDTNYQNPCIRSLIEHCMMGFYFVYSLMTTTPFEPPKIIANLHTLDKSGLISEWAQLDQRFLENFKENLNNTIEFNDKKITLDADFLFTFLNHSTHHRSQIMVALRMVGEKGCDTDYMTFLQSLKE